jgi:NAD(P)-dependent dehydrogenase (short-subunit alcohol dehydrogenase family)
MKVNRRKFLGVAGAAGVTTAGAYYLWQRRRSTRAPPVRPPGVPISAYGRDSTAEEVTRGLDLRGKTVLVTGATSGLGFETMRVLALRGAHVLGTGRTLAKAKEACALVSGRTTPIELELERWDSVASATDLVRALGVPLDALICNAGIMALPALEQVYGLEKQFVVNHLGHFILVNRLLDAVEAAEQGRVVMLSSMGYRWAPASGIEFDNLSGERDYQPNKMYGQSKLANALTAFELARRLGERGSRGTANAVHPGVINTNLGRHFEPWKRTAADLIGWTFMKSVAAGAATTCYVATAPALAATSGYYFEDCNPVVPEPGKHMDDAALATALWQKSVELTAEYL